MITEVNPLDHPDMKTYRNRTVLLISILLLSMIFGSMVPTAAAADINGPALEWNLVEPLPDKVESDDQVTVKLMFRNIGDMNLTGNKRATIELQSGGHTLDSIRLNDMRLNGTQQVVFRVALEGDGFHPLKLNADNHAGVVGLYDEEGKEATIGTVEVETIVEPFNWIPIIVIAVVAAVILGVITYMNKKKKAEEEAQRVVDEARRQEMIRKKEAVIAKKIKVRQMVGKHPRDYYTLRRTKYANLKPSGLTRAGLTILGRVKSKAELEEERIVCPKCGTELPEENAVCPRCS
ncbi:MAG: zinc ribbon domain-containing protein, partial [Candidatus Thermoplasmatota archaeon]|nr:zinc ribbon domain-containing protein [Candidatus Thermoplasmatota archaeon]